MTDFNPSARNRVIIVGAGPVGLVAALRLARAGIPVVVLEAADLPHAEPRASTFHPPTVDLLDELGLGERLVALGRPARTWQYCMFETGDRAVFDLGVLANDTNHPYRLQCEQLNLVIEAAKMLEAEQPGALIHRAKVTQVSQTDDGVAVDVEIEGEKTQLEGLWLIGADGASSVVRKDLGLAFNGETYPTVSISIGTPFAFEKHIDGLCGVNYFWADGWSFSMFQTKNMWRVGYSPPLDMKDDDAVSDEEVQTRLSRILPDHGPFDIVTARLYSVHRRLVERMRVGRILLAGDAAHLNSPSGGFGMNGGVHDAFNLTDKLIRVWNGEDDALLDQYARQRHYAASADIQKTSDANHKRHREKDSAKRMAALKEMQDTIADDAQAYKFLRESSLMDSLERANAIE
ncbi:MAG: FAD-dependent oxidoreductase [Alphaproteobacteria bacterium]|nr:FAD-dependent oxidoreductase [Alphaproteobacteria bacterium]